jgi:acetyl-CoA carboxylase biotin carboxyl carrier protein
MSGQNNDQNNDQTAKDIENLVELFNRSDWDEMHLKTDDLEVFLSNDPNASINSLLAPAATTNAPMPQATGPTGEASAPSSADTGNSASDKTKVVSVPEGMVAVTALNLGTFYRAPKPGAAPYVEVGQQIDENTDVCLIEVMKLFTPVKAGTAGKVHAVCIDDGTMVEFGDLLVIIDPS